MASIRDNSASDDYIHLCSALEHLGSLYCLELSSHSSNVFDTVVEETN
jgi:hypothetical protein